MVIEKVINVNDAVAYGKKAYGLIMALKTAQIMQSITYTIKKYTIIIKNTQNNNLKTLIIPIMQF